LRDPRPRDIDLLAVYKRDIVAPMDAYALGDRLAFALADLNIRVTVLLLHEQEHETSQFAREERAVQVWPPGVL
jgi:hypothetical protein